MVNIGGRSRGCLTCRTRRVKCDESRPICRRCQSLNLECGGPRGATFIHEEPAGPRTTRTHRQTTRPQQEAPLSLSAPPRTAGFEMYICYTQSHLLRDGLIVSAITDTKADDLMPLGTAVASRQVSHQAIMSFATILFGIQHRQPDIARQGYAMHGVTLRQLNQVLSDAARHTRDEAMTAVATLAICELLVPTGPNNSLTHMMGLERLVDLQDPVAFWSSRSPGFCKAVRFMIIVAALKLGKPSILARSDWKRAMRMNATCEELEEQDLFDVLADCSALLAERDAVISAQNANPSKAREQRDDIERRANCLLLYLRQWRQRWDSRSHLETTNTDTSGSAPGVEDSELQPTHNTVPEGSLITVATIPNLPATLMLMLYNLALMYVLQSLAPLPLEDSATQIQNLPNSPQLDTGERHRIGERIAAREACRCIQYYLSVGCRFNASAPPIVHWAFTAAWTKLRRDESVEGAWMRELLTGNGPQVVAEGLWTTYKWLNSVTE